MNIRIVMACLATGCIVACAGGGTTGTPSPTGHVAAVTSIPNQAATVGVAFHFDATLNQTAFSDPVGGGLTYTVVFSADSCGLAASGTTIAGTPFAPGTTMIAITARDAAGSTATDSFAVVTFSAGLATPVLPALPFQYADAEVGLPSQYTSANAPFGDVAATDNTPADNPITDAGATLGRVLFYDTRLSVNDRVACGSCHLQAHGFSDTAQFSHGFLGGLTTRHSIGLDNSRYYQRGRFFWDERAATLEIQTLIPIQNEVEMGSDLGHLAIKLALTSYYPALFQAAFGTPDVTSDRISKALAQFVRSLSTYHSRFDQALAGNGPPNFGNFTAQEMLGLELFMPIAGSPVQSVGCNRCHTTSAQVGDNVHNNGLDLFSVDIGAGDGRFKAPSLRNAGVRAAFMHDGRFQTLQQVVEHYSTGVEPNPALDPLLKNPDGSPHELNLTSPQVDALVAFLNTLTDSTFLTDPRFANPFHPGP